MEIHGYSLDNYQMSAVYAMNDAIVVVAGAGSGKSLTIEGKIKYLINNLNFKEKEILAISFTKASVDSLKNKLLEENINIDVYTFHKLALTLLKNYNYKIVNINYLKYIINEYLKSYINYNKKRNRLFRNIFYMDYSIDKVLLTKEYEELIYKIEYFINLVKSNNINIYDLGKMYKKTFFNNKELLRIIIEVYLIYERELESTNQIDFNDMLIKATKVVKNIHLNYKYIIIDEFQDTSIARFTLILEIIKYTNAKLMVVGDDYQSIYKFNGCKIDLFLNVNKYIEDTKYIYLKYTYRNSNELIYVSSNFVMKNKSQLKKSIISNKNNNKPIKILFNYSLDEVLKIINDVLILTRNNKELDEIDYPNKMTIHKSKGLEYENVVLYNSDNLPNRIKEDNLFNLVLSKDKNIMYEEERRLFYVALTRTKNNIYIMVNKKISPFVKELIHDYKNFIEIFRH